MTTGINVHGGIYGLFGRILLILCVFGTSCNAFFAIYMFTDYIHCQFYVQLYSFPLLKRVPRFHIHMYT